jgi:hypothetical protein
MIEGPLAQTNPALPVLVSNAKSSLDCADHG